MQMAEADSRRDIHAYLDEITDDELTMWIAFHNIKAEAYRDHSKSNANMQTPSEFDNAAKRHI